jgi:hypothetical protein
LSLVIAVCSRTQIVIAGDTQLNDDNGVLPITGMKVIPVGQYAIAGFTGDYDGTIQVGHLFSAKPELYSASLKSKADAICEVLLDHKIECNFVLAGFENGVTKLICTGKDYNYKFQVEDVKNGTVRALLPPDLTIENCIRFFPSTFNLRSQTVSCIKTLSQNSKSVNDKICGFEVTTNGLRCFTDGISYEDISYRLTKE